MARKKDDRKLAQQRDEIRGECQKLVLGLLKRATKELTEADKDPKAEIDYARLMGVLDKGTRYLAMDNKIDEGDYGEGLHEDLD